MRDINTQSLAREFVRSFCGVDLVALEDLLAPNLRFRGPLHRSDSRAELLRALREAPPRACDFKILHMTGAGDEVAVFYDYLKPGGAVTIAQWFRMRAGRIAETRLVFDVAQAARTLPD